MLKTKELVDKICHILDQKKAQDITILHVEKLTIVADYFVVASGTSNIQVKALCDELEFQLEQLGEKPLRTDGYSEGRWIVLDYASVIVHIFREEERLFYHLERLWEDGTNSTKYHTAD